MVWWSLLHLLVLDSKCWGLVQHPPHYALLRSLGIMSVYQFAVWYALLQDLGLTRPRIPLHYDVTATASCEEARVETDLGALR
jgi:hypothetical protein